MTMMAKKIDCRVVRSAPLFNRVEKVRTRNKTSNRNAVGYPEYDKTVELNTYDMRGKVSHYYHNGLATNFTA